MDAGSVWRAAVESILSSSGKRERARGNEIEQTAMEQRHNVPTASEGVVGGVNRVVGTAVMEHSGVAILDYDLHKLGWRAFQDLCAVILQQVLGQTFHTFADSNDAGRDGAFQGEWAIHATRGKVTVAAGTATVAQCKFSVKSASTLTPSMLADELDKVKNLQSKGLCDAYLLLTNLSVTGRTEEWLIQELRTRGVRQCLVLDGNWICQQINQSPVLRRYVPRVYGLGDLGNILDDRRLRQARALLDRLEEDLATFVPTDPYRQAAEALADHGFALLLGEPACGKSTIAATLSLAALDTWGCGVRRVDSADELVASWNPDEPGQLFWVDDAFGSIRLDAGLTDGWARRMDQVSAAIKSGARVILTSRDYIYHEARKYLKEYAYPRLREQQVVVDIAALTEAERRQILYNHLKAGDQPRSVRAHWAPHLRLAAAVDRFQPEVARRLSWQAFTNGVQLRSADDLVRYFERPLPFLGDILRQLEPAARAALACVYLSGNELAAPLQFTPALEDAVARLGATQSSVLQVFPALESTFLQKASNPQGDPVWRFRHPTIREGFAAVIAEDVNAVTVFLDGLSDRELLQQIECGGAATRGTVVRVPASLYPRVIPRIRIAESPLSPWSDPCGAFLTTRCSPAFLREWAKMHVGDLERLLSFGHYINAYWQPKTLARLQEAGALPEAIRRKAVERIEELAMEMLDTGWLDEPVRHLLTAGERKDLLDRIREEILPNIEDEIHMSADGYDSDVDSTSRYRAAREAIPAYKNAFGEEPSIVAQLEEAERYIDAAVSSAQEDDHEQPPAARLAGPANSQPAFDSNRDEFDDVAYGD